MPFAIFPFFAAQAGLAVVLMSQAALTGRKAPPVKREAFTVETRCL